MAKRIEIQLDHSQSAETIKNFAEKQKLFQEALALNTCYKMAGELRSTQSCSSHSRGV